MAKSKLRKLAKGCGWLSAFGLAAAGAIVYFWVDFPIAAMRYGAAEERARNAGIPLTLEDLRQYPAPPPEQNAAKVYPRVLPESPAVLWDGTREIELALWDDVVDAGRALRAVESLSPVADKLHQASLLPYVDHRWDLDRDILPQAEGSVSLWTPVRFFAGRAVAHAHLGQAEEAARDLATAQRMGRHKVHHRLPRSAFGAVIAHTRATEGVQLAAEALARNPQGLALLKQELMTEEEFFQGFRQTMLREAYLSIALARNVDVHTDTHPARTIMGVVADEWYSQFLNEPLDTAYSSLVPVHAAQVDEAKIRRSGSPPGWMLRGSMARLLDAWSEYFEALPETGATFEDFQKATKRLELALRKSRLSYAFGRHAALSYAETHAALLQPATDIRVTRAYISVLQFRNEHGRWPESLEEAGVQELDPFNNEPLRYRLDGEGFRVWSVNRDGRDNPGRYGDDTVAIFPNPEQHISRPHAHYERMFEN